MTNYHAGRIQLTRGTNLLEQNCVLGGWFATNFAIFLFFPSTTVFAYHRLLRSISEVDGCGFPVPVPLSKMLDIFGGPVVSSK